MFVVRRCYFWYVSFSYCDNHSLDEAISRVLHVPLLYLASKGKGRISEIFGVLESFKLLVSDL